MLVRNSQTYLRRYSMTNLEKIDKLKNRLQSLKEQHALEHQKCEAAEAEEHKLEELEDEQFHRASQ